ncbi:hypothetical protein ABZ930_35775 [Streptomyces sp. NPDC046716]|uniref:hypothetical protein n=1 Tax=Streptomyces sp. NPDC046716 TaxID=3157093 RepID=UPI0033DAA8CB
MSDQRPAQQPAPRPGPRWGHAPPEDPQITDAYRRRAVVLTRLALVVGGCMAVAFAISVAFLFLADSDSRKSGYGYLAIFIWFGLAVVAPVLLAFAVPASVMTRRVRQQDQARNMSRWGG